MTNSIAIALLLLVLGLVAADYFWLHLNLPLIVARQLDGFIEYLSFWR